MAWPFGRKRSGPFDPFDFGDFEKEFERMRGEMERMMGEMGNQPGAKAQRYGPIVHGFSMRVGPDGKPVFQEFGNVKPPTKEAPSGEREPLVDVIEEKESVVVIVELPGVEKSDIKLNSTENSLAIKVDTSARKYSKKIELPAPVKPQSAKANYKNGVLEVRLERKEPKKESGTQIPVE